MTDTTIDEIFAEFGRKCSPVATLRNVDNPLVRREYIDQAKSALYDLILKEVVGETIPLNAHIDDELLRYVPDMKERSLEVTGVSSAFTTLYTRALVQQVQQEMRNKLKELFDE